MDKKRLRTELIKAQNALDAEYMAESDRKIFETLISLPELLRAKRVFLYYSVGREVDTLRLMEYCVREHLPYALPRTYRGGKMEFCPADGKTALVPKPPYNIPEPPEDAPPVSPEAGDVIIVPALAFDSDGYRIGHGAGYYDRFLENCPAYSIGVCREKLLVARLPREAHDVAVNRLVTDKELSP